MDQNPQPQQSSLILPSHDGTNLAPLKPLIAIRDKASRPSTYLQDALKERFQHYAKQDEDAWKEIYGWMGLIDRFIKGEQSLRRNVVTGEWKIWNVKNQTTEAQRQINIMRFYSSVALSKWVTSNPDVRVDPGAGNDANQDAVESAKAATQLVDYYEEKWFDEWFNLQEGGLALRGGTYIDRIRFDSGLKSIKVIRDIIETVNVSGGTGWGNCGECLYQGEANTFGSSYAPEQEQADANVIQTQELPTCPRCGSEAVMVDKPQTTQMPSIVGQEPQWMGDLVCEQRPLPCLRWDIRKRLEDSNYLIDQSRTTLAQVRALLGDVKIQGDAGDLGLDILDSLALNKPDAGRAKYYREPVTAVEFWINRDELSDIVLGQDEQTVSGQIIPKGKLIDNLPERICVQGFNGLNVITGIFGESHKTSYVAGVWHMNPISGVGDGGLKDTVEVQKRFNKSDSQAIAMFGGTATPGTLFVEGAIEEQHIRLIGVPDKAIPVNLSQIPNVQKLQDAIMRLPPGNMGAGFMDYVYNQLTNYAQLTSHNIQFTGGMPGVNNKTATGAQITDVNANALYLPPLQIKAYTRKKSAELIVNLYRKHFKIERSFPFGGKQGGRQGAKKLSGANICRDLVFRVVKNSEYPKSIFTQREDSIAMFTMLGGAEGLVALQAANSQLADYLTSLFGFEMPGTTFDELASLCNRRLDMMKAALPLAEMLGQMGMPGAMVLVQSIQPPICLEEPKHMEKMQWWQDALDIDELQECPIALRDAAKMVIQEHFNFSTGAASIIQTAMGVAQTMGAQPGMQVQNELGQQQQQEQIAIEDQRTAQDAERQAQEGEVSHERELEKIGLQQDHEAKLAKMSQKEKKAA